MKIMPFLAALVTATSIGMATGPAWSDETTQGGSAAQTPATASYPTRGRYPTPPRQRGYMQRWQQPPRWPAPPSGYGQMRPYYPPQTQHQAAPAAPAKQPVSTESKQPQEPLTEKSTELDRAELTIEQLQLKLQHSREAEHALNEKVAAITGEQQALQAQVAKLQEQLQTSNATLQQRSQQITSDQQQNLTLTSEHERLRSDLDNRDKQLATMQAELLAARQSLQQAQSGNSLSSEQLGTAITQAGTLKDLLTELRTRLENRQTMQQPETTQSVQPAMQQAQPETTPSAQPAVQQAQPETTPSVQPAVQQAQPETKAFEQQADANDSEVAMLRSVLGELKIQLENTNIRLQDAEQELAACRQDQTRAK